MTGAARVASFVALAAFASWHWFALVADPPVGRWLALVALTATLAGALHALRRVPGRWPRRASAALLVAATLAAGLLVCGVDARLVAPAGWPDLRAGLDSGLAGVSQLSLPYDGPDAWTRLGLLAAAPVVLTACTAIAFWPGPGAAGRLVAGLIGLVALYGFAITWEAPSAEPARGLALLALLAALLWLGRVPAGRGAAAASAVAIAGILALPVASRVEADEPLVNYRSWALFGSEREVAFNWIHSYGPFEWPQQGTELLEIRSDRPLLWRASVLDAFDGVRWLRAPTPPTREVPSRLAGASTRLVQSNRERGWSVFPGVQVRALRSSLLVGAGTIRAVEGVETEPIEADGTTPLDDALGEGDSYAVEGYAPDPSPLEMRRAEGPYPRPLGRYTELTLQSARVIFGSAGPAVAPLELVRVPLRATPDGGRRDDIAAAVAGTEYERVYRLARRLTGGAATAYDAVSAVERHLRTSYRYEQEVPERRDPLPAFLFADRAGYCQQFSGAMALILRMVGIPSRVATGFSPGSKSPDDNVYTVRDTDAHSWVEVWFRGIGWVAFDPTPPAAPAESQLLATLRGGAAAASAAPSRALSEERAAEVRAGTRQATGGGVDGSSALAAVALGVAALGALAATALARLRRRRLLRPGGAVLQLRELERALPRLGYELPAGATLLAIERTLASAAGPVPARYAAWLRASRYAAERPRRPGPPERRALRRALARASRLGRPRAAWRALRAIPPGGPRG